MSDYHSECQDGIGPLFEQQLPNARPEVSKPASSNARQFHESVAHVASVLETLRTGSGLTKLEWEDTSLGARLAPVIDKLRNAHGFTIEGDGSLDRPYRMPVPDQYPTRISTTPAMKLAYYESAHWAFIRECRFQFDSNCCVLCGTMKNLQCHHIMYSLFSEQLRELMTVCEDCHRTIHEHSRLAFPTGIDIAHARRLVNLEIEPWLLPKKEAAQWS